MGTVIKDRGDPWGLKEGRWGGNDQPALSDVNYVLGMLPIEDARLLSHDKLYIKMHEPLTFWQAFILGRLNPDDPPEGISDTQTEFTFWWD